MALSLRLLWCFGLAGVMFFSPAPSREQAQGIEFELERDSIAAGESTVIRWSFPSADSVFISQIGKVPSSGEAIVKPLSSTSYFLIAEDVYGTHILTARLGVLGSKDADDMPDLRRFRHLRSFTVNAHSFPDLAETVHGVLQDSLRHTVTPLLPKSSGGVVFVTNVRQRPDLVGPNERKIGSRRVAYLVDIGERDSAAGSYSYSIQTLIEYRKRIESTWRPETDDNLFDALARQLAQRINE